MVSTKRCTKSVGMRKNTNKLNNPELAQAIVRLQEAKKEDIYPAIELCLSHYRKCEQHLRTLKIGIRFVKLTNIHAITDSPGEIYQDKLTKSAHQPSVPSPPGTDASPETSNLNITREEQPSSYSNEVCPNGYSQDLEGILDNYDWGSWVKGAESDKVDWNSWTKATESIPGSQSFPVLEGPLAKFAYQPSVPLPPATESRISNPDYTQGGQPCRYLNGDCPNIYSQCLEGILDGYGWD